MADQPTADRMLRLFIALELPEPWRRALESCEYRQERLAPGYFRWVRADLLHLTLVFLGSQPEAMLGPAAEALARAAGQHRPFELTLGGVGKFGPPRQPRVLWVATAERTPALQPLRASLERELARAGLDFDAKPLVPHITLGRARHERPSRTPARAPELIARPADAAAHRFEAIVLVESELGLGSPRYTVRARTALGGGPPG